MNPGCCTSALYSSPALPVRRQQACHRGARDGRSNEVLRLVIYEGVSLKSDHDADTSCSPVWPTACPAVTHQRGGEPLS